MPFINGCLIPLEIVTGTVDPAMAAAAVPESAADE